HRRVGAAGDRVARIRRAGVAVVAVERRPRGAGAGLTGLGPVADVAVEAQRPVGHGDVPAAERGIAAVGGADVVVVAVRRRGGGAVAALAGLQPVARVAVAAGGAVRDRGGAAPRGRRTAVRRARIAVVAHERRAGRTGATLAGLRAVAEVPVAARGAVGHGD